MMAASKSTTEDDAITACAIALPARSIHSSSSAPISPQSSGEAQSGEGSRPSSVTIPFQRGDRGDVDQLARSTVRSRHRHRAQRAGIATAARIKAAVDDDAPADEGTDIEIDEIIDVLGLAEHQFGAAGGSHVVLQIDRERAKRRDLLANIAVAPFVHDRLRRADRIGPFPQFERRGNANSGDPFALLWRQRLHHLRHALGGEAEDRFRRRIIIRHMQHGTDVAEKIDQHQIGAAAPDLQPKEKCAFRIERHGDQWLADAAAQWLLARQELVSFQHAHDDRARLRRKSGHPGDRRLGEAAVLAQKRKHHALVMIAHATLVCTVMKRRPGSSRAGTLRYSNAQGPGPPMNLADNGDIGQCCQY